MNDTLSSRQYSTNLQRSDLKMQHETCNSTQLSPGPIIKMDYEDQDERPMYHLPQSSDNAKDQIDNSAKSSSSELKNIATNMCIQFDLLFAPLFQMQNAKTMFSTAEKTTKPYLGSILGKDITYSSDDHSEVSDISLDRGIIPFQDRSLEINSLLTSNDDSISIDLDDEQNNLDIEDSQHQIYTQTPSNVDFLTTIINDAIGSREDYDSSVEHTSKPQIEEKESIPILNENILEGEPTPKVSTSKRYYENKFTESNECSETMFSRLQVDLEEREGFQQRNRCRSEASNNQDIKTTDQNGDKLISIISKSPKLGSVLNQSYFENYELHAKSVQDNMDDSIQTSTEKNEDDTREPCSPNTCSYDRSSLQGIQSRRQELRQRIDHLMKQLENSGTCSTYDSDSSFSSSLSSFGSNDSSIASSQLLSIEDENKDEVGISHSFLSFDSSQDQDIFLSFDSKCFNNKTEADATKLDHLCDDDMSSYSCLSTDLISVHYDADPSAINGQVNKRIIEIQIDPLATEPATSNRHLSINNTYENKLHKNWIEYVYIGERREKSSYMVNLIPYEHITTQ